VTADRSLPPPDPDDRVPPAPWSFRIMVALAVLYLGWRLVEGVIWVVGKLS
jgi:hypothetical protein